MELKRAGIWTTLRVLLVVCAVVMAGCSSKEEKLADFLAKGDKLLAAGDPVRAVLEYKNALQIDVKNVRATVGLGKAFMAQQDFQKAFVSFKSAVELDEGCDEARVEMASLLALGKQGQAALDELAKLKNPAAFQPKVEITKATALASLEKYDEAINALSKIEGRDQNKEAQVLLAFCFRAVRSFDSMKEALEKWRKIEPQDPSSYLFMAQYAAENKDTETAAAELKKMVDVKPEETARALLRAQSLEKLGLLAEAEAAYEALPAGKEMLAAKADFQMRRKQPAKARPLLEEIIAANPGEVAAVATLAQIYVDENAFDSASKIIEKALEQDLKKPDRERMLLAKAALKARQGDRNGAKELVSGVLKENQGNMDAHLLMGKLLLKDRNPRDAELHLSQAGQARPEDEEAQILLSRSQILNKNDAMAGDTLRRAVEAAPKSQKLRLELFRYLWDHNDRDQAMKVIDQGIELQPKDIALLKMRGEIAATQKSWAKAEKDFIKIIEINPSIPLGYIQMGRLMASQGKIDEAISWLKQGMNAERGWEAALPALLEAYFVKGDRNAAPALARAETDKRPDSALAWFFLGMAQERSENLAEAQKAYAKAAELAPESPEPRRGLASVYVKEGGLEKAISRFEEAAKANPSTSAFMQLAILYENAGKYKESIETYEKIGDKSKRPDILNNLAYLYVEHKADKESLQKASEMAAQALSLHPENPNFLDTAAWVAYKQGDLDSALNYIQEARAITSNEAVHDLHAAMIFNARGDRQQAVECLKTALEGKLDKPSKEKALELQKEWGQAQ